MSTLAIDTWHTSFESEMLLSAAKSRIQRPVLQYLCESSRAINIERQYLATHEFMALGSTARIEITKCTCVQVDKEINSKGGAELLLLVLFSSRVGDGDTGEIC